ncbi:hypothetical protein PY32053_03928 (plasmid) [Paracoccus yeei]|uniref:Uncharacterized protein n=1 Tax=Paracoccus yeei TaxID=147645 RepID=A0A386UT72_9RHOB|nr:hypothetical protein PY32053_03928 [Paracoccus yeei]
MRRNRYSCGMVLAASALLAWAAPATARSDFGFDVTVTLSQKAAATLASTGEEIVLFADYYGEPKRGAERHTNEIGQISLDRGDEQVEIPGTGGSAHISGATLDAKRLDWISGPMMVNVNVASARKSNADNILSCDFIDGAFVSVKKAPITLHCALIEENYDTIMKP